MTETGREIRKEYNVKLGVIRSALKKYRAYKGKLFARLVIEGVRLNLIHFEARAVNPWNVKGRRRRPGGGVSVKILVRGGRKLIRGAFITAAGADIGGHHREWVGGSTPRGVGCGGRGDKEARGW